MGKEGEHRQLSIVTIDSRDPVRGERQKQAFLAKYLPALLAGRLSVPRRNMRLDWAVESVVDNCLKCSPKDPETRSRLALEIIEKSPYPVAKMKALGILEEQFGEWDRPFQKKSQFLPGEVRKLISVSDLSDNEEFRIASFVLAANIGGTLVRNSYLAEKRGEIPSDRPDYYPDLSRSLAAESDEKCFVAKFINISRYLKTITSLCRDLQPQEEKTTQLLGILQVKIEALDPLKAVDFIFSVIREYTQDCLEEIIFAQPPLDLETFKKICREAPPEQRAEVENRVRDHLSATLVGHTGLYAHTNPRVGHREARRALIQHVFPLNNILSSE